MKIVYKECIFEAMGFIKDDKLYVDPAKITPAQYSTINGRLKGEGYDVRGPNDIKEILNSYKKETIEGVEYVRVGGSDDWSRIIGNVLKITEPIKIIKDENVLAQFMKNVSKDKSSGISFGDYISNSTTYILPSGKTINFRSGSGGFRGDDHRYVVSYLDKSFSNGTDGMYYFMDNTGAIRFIPESPSFDLRTEPTSIQLNKIVKFVDNLKSGEVGVDLYSRNFGRKGKFYPAGTRGAKVKADILRFYSSGETGLDMIRESISYKGFIYEAEEYLDLEDELNAGNYGNIEELLNRWKDEDGFTWTHNNKGFYVLKYDRRDDYKVIVGNNLIDIDNLIRDPNAYHEELPIFANLSQVFNDEFWKFPQGLYHATDCKNIPLILKDGLNPGWGTSLSNRGHHGAFTSTEPEGYIDSYGDCKVFIDTLAMKKDGVMPFVELEPEVFTHRVGSSVYHYFGIDEEFIRYSESGEDENTYIVDGGVPAKYISKVED